MIAMPGRMRHLLRCALGKMAGVVQALVMAGVMLRLGLLRVG